MGLNMFKINGLSVLFFMIWSYSFLSGQPFGNNISIPISLSISNGPIIKEVSGNLDFGDVYSLTSIQTLTRDPEFGVLFEVNGKARSRVSVNYSSTVPLDNSNWVSVNSGATGSIVFTPNVMHTSRNPTYTNPRNLRNGRRIRLRNVNGIGKLFIWVGGDMEIKANQEIGDYEGIFNITVAY